MCIAAEGAGTHDLAAVPGEHVSPPRAMQIVEFRQRVEIVRSFIADA